MRDPLQMIKGGLVVSCQASQGNPMHGPGFMAAMAQAAAAGGAVGLRAEGAADVAAVSRATGLPTIGIRKVGTRSDGVFITPTFPDAAQVVQAGAVIVATDGTPRQRPEGITLAKLIARIHDELAVPVMADVDSLASALHAAASGADLLATTLSGYTGSRPVPTIPDLDLITELTRASSLPVVAEGRMWTPQQVSEAFDRGAHAVVVGTAITNPLEITRRFVAALPHRDSMMSL